MSAPDPAAGPVPPAPRGCIAGGRSVGAAAGWRWIAEGWRIFRLQPGTWIGVSVVFLFLYTLASLVPFVGSLAVTVGTPAAFAGLLLGCRDLEAGGRLSLAHLGAGFRGNVGPLFALGALYLAAVVVVLFVVLLLAGVTFGLLFAAGVEPDGAMAALLIALVALTGAGLSMPVVMAFWMATPLILFHGLGPVPAIRASFIGCLRNSLPFLLYGCVTLLLMIPATLPFLLGWLVLMPVLYGSYYASYRDIFTTPG